MPYEIRPYRTADEAQVLEVWLSASRVGHPFLPEDGLRREAEIVRDVYLPQAETWVAEQDGRILGFVGLLDSFVGGLFVAPDAHGRGVGRRLVDHAFARKGPLTVEVYEQNPIAPGFYRRCGFVQTGRKELDDQGRPHPLLVLRKDAP